LIAAPSDTQYQIDRQKIKIRNENRSVRSLMQAEKNVQE